MGNLSGRSVGHFMGLFMVRLGAGLPQKRSALACIGLNIPKAHHLSHFVLRISAPKWPGVLRIQYTVMYCHCIRSFCWIHFIRF